MINLDKKKWAEQELIGKVLADVDLLTELLFDDV